MSARSRTVWALGLTQTLAWGSTYYLPAILADSMAAELGMSTTTVFAAFSLALIVTALLGPAAGQRVDRRGGRGLLVLSNLLFAVGLACLGLAQGATMVWVAWLVIGVGMALGLYETAFATLTRLYGHGARAPITGITLLAGFASTVCWPLTAWLEGELGWRVACLFWAALQILLGLPLNRLLIPAADPLPRVGRNVTMRERPNSDLTMALLAFVFATTWFTSTAMAAHLPELLETSGLAPAAAIAAAALVGPAQVAARFSEFILLQRFHPLVSARIGAMAHPLGALALSTVGAPAAMFFTTLHGAGNGVLTIAKGTLPLAMFGPDGYGRRQGVLMVPARFAQALAPFLFAMLIDILGRAALGVTAGLGLMALGALSILSTARTDHATSSTS